MKKIIAWLLLTSLSFLGEPVYASDEDNDTLKNIYGDEDYLYIATGRKQTVSQAPAVASIISAKTMSHTQLVAIILYIKYVAFHLALTHKYSC